MEEILMILGLVCLLVGTATLCLTIGSLMALLPFGIALGFFLSYLINNAIKGVSAQ